LRRVFCCGGCKRGTALECPRLDQCPALGDGAENCGYEIETETGE